MYCFLTLDNYVYIFTAFLGSSKINIMELCQEISSRTITDVLLPYSGRDVNKTGSYDSFINKIDGTFVKPIIVHGIIGSTFITLVVYHWMLLYNKSAIGIYTFILSCDNPP